MAYHDDLLDLAFELIGKDRATQADLRRAVSTAYYALFHLLVAETTLNWSRDSSRNALGRMFDHAMMKRVSDLLAKKRPLPARIRPSFQLRVVFDAIVPIASAKSAFLAWNDIKHTDIPRNISSPS